LVIVGIPILYALARRSARGSNLVMEEEKEE